MVNVPAFEHSPLHFLSRTKLLSAHSRGDDLLGSLGVRHRKREHQHAELQDLRFPCKHQTAFADLRIGALMHQSWRTVSERFCECIFGGLTHIR